MALRVCGTSVLFSLLSAQLAVGQVRQISGRVTNSQTQGGVPEATVSVSGTSIVAGTNNQGNYVLNAPAGDVSLVVRAIGYKRQQIAVPASQPRADFALEPDAVQPGGDRHHRAGHRPGASKPAQRRGNRLLQ